MIETLFTYNPTLMSLRTAKYIESTIREGDNFDYQEWLRRVREEEAQAKRPKATGTQGGLAPAQKAVPVKTFDDQHFGPSPAPPLTAKTLLTRALRRSHRQAKSPTPKARLRRWLKKIRFSWDDFQASRARDAVYGYLEAVFAIVTHFRVRRRTTRLLRHAFDFAHLPFDKNANPFSVIIRSTCGGGVDSKND
jgi:hypothetical protein